MKEFYNKLKQLSNIWMIVMAALLITSCQSDPLSPGVEFMPDMYRSPSYETYGENAAFGGKDSMEARMPVKGSIARGHIPYAYPNTTEGYELAGKELMNPIPFSPEVLAKGKVEYEKMCMHCHGKTGEGDGAVALKSDFINPPSYSSPLLKDLPDGKIYHTLMYGKGMMGSHASQINEDDRWKIIYYVGKLQGKTGVIGNGENGATMAGKEVFMNICMACHQMTGEGIPGAFPPLAKSDYLMKDRNRAIKQIINGSEGTIVVNGQTFIGAMPGQAQLNNQEIANVLTYVMNNWGNSAAPITIAEVKANR